MTQDDLTFVNDLAGGMLCHMGLLSCHPVSVHHYVVHHCTVLVMCFGSFNGRANPRVVGSEASHIFVDCHTFAHI